MNPLDSYLARIARELRFMPSSRRGDELKELRSHLEQRVEDFRHQGLNPEAAQQQTTEAFGSPYALGSRLTDAWEGIPFSWWRIVATCVVVTIIHLVSSVIVGIQMTILAGQSSVALFPELFPLIMAFYLSVPMLCGALFSHWLGRRGRLIGTTYFVLHSLVFHMNLRFDPHASSTMAAPPAFFTGYINSLWFPLLTVVLAFIGAALFHARRMRPRGRMAEVNGLALDLRPVRILRIPFNPRTWIRTAMLCALFAVVGTARVWLTLHPSTPVAALRYSFITGNMSNGFEAPQFVEMRELPPTTPAELAGRERRIRFQLQVSAKPYFAANQLAYLGRQAAVQAQSKYGVDSRTREAMARVRANSQVVKGVARLIQTPKGWQVDGDSFDQSQMWSWFYVR